MHKLFASDFDGTLHIWEDDSDYEGRISYLNSIRADIKNTLTDLGYEDVVIRQRGHLAIDVNQVSCDYYEYLDNKGMEGSKDSAGINWLHSVRVLKKLPGCKLREAFMDFWKVRKTILGS